MATVTFIVDSKENPVSIMLKLALLTSFDGSPLDGFCPFFNFWKLIVPNDRMHQIIKDLTKQFSVNPIKIQQFLSEDDESLLCSIDEFEPILNPFIDKINSVPNDVIKWVQSLRSINPYYSNELIHTILSSSYSVESKQLIRLMLLAKLLTDRINRNTDIDMSLLIHEIKSRIISKLFQNVGQTIVEGIINAPETPSTSRFMHKNNTFQIVGPETNIVALRKDTLDYFSSDNARIVQIIGDCVMFGAKQCVFIKNVVSDLIEPSDIIEWGLTGKYQYEHRFDVNNFVDNLIYGLSLRSIANVVDRHTPMAINDWRLQCSVINNFFTVYRNKIVNTALFGDDVAITDGLCDVLICVEGGIQSFLQIVNCLIDNKKCYVISGLRSENGAKYFSAADFIERMLKSDNVLATKNSYFAEKELCDKTKGDACTKQALFDKAWDKFILHQVRSKLNEVVFYSFN